MVTDDWIGTSDDGRATSRVVRDCDVWDELDIGAEVVGLLFSNDVFVVDVAVGRGWESLMNSPQKNLKVKFHFHEIDDYFL